MQMVKHWDEFDSDDLNIIKPRRKRRYRGKKRRRNLSYQNLEEDFKRGTKRLKHEQDKYFDLSEDEYDDDLEDGEFSDYINGNEGDIEKKRP
jgi:hypothetical protein